jgi:hypothetical protein
MATVIINSSIPFVKTLEERELTAAVYERERICLGGMGPNHN